MFRNIEKIIVGMIVVMLIISFLNIDHYLALTINVIFLLLIFLIKIILRYLGR